MLVVLIDLVCAKIDVKLKAANEVVKKIFFTLFLFNVCGYITAKIIFYFMLRSGMQIEFGFSKKSKLPSCLQLAFKI
jgi:hypothetical protein